VIKSGGINLVLDEKALRATMTGPNGPVAKHLARLGGKIESRAKVLASGELVNVRTGRYRSSLTWRMFTRGDRIGVAIGSGVHYARFIESGSRYMNPRRVLSTAAGQVLGKSII